MLIFLDIDGVLVSAAHWKTPVLMEDGFPVFLAKAVESLNSLISSDTEIILSTSHRDRFSLQDWKDVFKKRGIIVKHLDKLPSSHQNRKRKNEIQDWFASNNKPERFLIIDDDKSLYDLPKDLKEHLIITDPIIGLTKDKLKKLEVRV
ncbi:HAD domain-containing protein [Algoriphagus sp.]|uniref:HAD domain-containing protein n=1 Tax=Algoriphagus sp. TaxID=1872435 RepID=UPI002634C65F|nr:HAD domain-containing protein [Algoriphagus sp.]